MCQCANWLRSDAAWQLAYWHIGTLAHWHISTLNIMRILILGAGKMGSFFTDILSFQHETAVFDVNPHQLRFVYNTYRFTTLEEIKDFEPELVINAVTVKYTLDAFRQVLPVLPKDCIISDIASVKTGLKKFYDESGFRYVSTHPMFGPTLASS